MDDTVESFYVGDDHLVASMKTLPPQELVAALWSSYKTGDIHGAGGSVSVRVSGGRVRGKACYNRRALSMCTAPVAQ
jgi:hypothetical protein